jgi:HEAT repeat protein
LLRVTGLGTAADFRKAATDDDPAVRLQAIHGLVRQDDVPGLSALAADPSREVRVAAARGLGTTADPHGAEALLRLATDADVLVRAAALRAAALLLTAAASLATTTSPPTTAPLPTTARHFEAPLSAVALSALADPAWQVREGAAVALGAADPDRAVPALLAAAGDDNLDVRRAAVRSLAGWAAERDDVIVALRAAAADPDADVRAYARRALADGTPVYR